MSMIPKILTPKLYAIRNYWARRERLSKTSFRDYVMLAFGLSVMVSIYLFVRWILMRLNADPNLVFLPPSLPLGLILMVLLFMLFLSNAVIAVGTLYFGADLELVIASPLRPYQFFVGKLIYIVFSASWTSMIFIAPLVAGFGVSFSAGWPYYVLSVVSLVPYFVIPAAASVVLATLLVRFLPPRSLKYMLYVIAVLLLGALVLGSDFVRMGVASARDHGQILRILTLVSAANASWLPSTWVANTLQNLLQHQGRSFWEYSILSYSCAIAACALAYLSLRIWHFDAYCVARNQGSRRRVKPREEGNVHWTQRLPFAANFRGLLVKDGKIFVREVTSTLQVAMLGAMCLIYLFNVRLFSGVEGLPIEMQRWWRSFFFISNWCIGAFVTTGVCTRFVFPAISLEGRNLWILLCAPLSLPQVLHAKFRLWYPPVALVSVAVLSAGALAMDAAWTTLAVNFISGFIVAHGITGLAIGMGARFASFDWEHPSELAASFGTLVFMLASVALIAVSLFIAWGTLSFNVFVMVGIPLHAWGGLASVLLGLVSMAGLHLAAAYLAMRSGSAALAAREFQ